MRDGTIAFFGLMLWSVGDLSPKEGPFWIILVSVFLVNVLTDKWAEKQEKKKLKDATQTKDSSS